MSNIEHVSEPPVAILFLEDKTMVVGYSCGALPPNPLELMREEAREGADAAVPVKAHGGEVVFNTAMSGYPEILSDPSYGGQIVVMTYPMIGNYGVRAEWSEAGYEAASNTSTIQGLVMRMRYEGKFEADAHAKGRPPIPAGAPLNVPREAQAHDLQNNLVEDNTHRGRVGIDTFLRRCNIPGLYDADTRRVVLHIRAQGELRGAIFAAPPGFRRWDSLDRVPADWQQAAHAAVQKIVPMEGRSMIAESGTAAPAVVSSSGTPFFVLIDCGVKSNIVRELKKRGGRIEIMPSGTTADQILALKPDGVLFSNGPGDPAPLAHQVEVARGLIGKTVLFGICLGHQVISMALGAVTYKMKFGHHGANHPVRDEDTGRVFVTSQNHGFAVDEKKVPKNVEIWFRNANDHTIEGLRDTARGIYTTQFHPEAAPGPHDARWIFDTVFSHAK